MEMNRRIFIKSILSLAALPMVRQIDYILPVGCEGCFTQEMFCREILYPSVQELAEAVDSYIAEQLLRETI